MFKKGDIVVFKSYSEDEVWLIGRFCNDMDYDIGKNKIYSPKFQYVTPKGELVSGTLNMEPERIRLAAPAELLKARLEGKIDLKMLDLWK